MSWILFIINISGRSAIFDEAENRLIMALEMAKDANLQALQQKYYKELSFFYDSQAAPEKAAEYSLRHIAISDSLDGENNQHAIAQYEMEQKEMKAQHEIETLESKRKNQVRKPGVVRYGFSYCFPL